MSPEDLKCPACGARVYPSDDRCLACGARLDAGSLVQEAPGTPPAEVPQAVPYQVLPGAQPWDPRDLGVGGGFFERLARGWAFLKQAWMLLGRDGRLLVPSALAVLVGGAILAATVVVLRATGYWDLLFTKSKESDYLFWAVAVPLSLVLFIVAYLFQGMTVRLVADLLARRRCTLGMALADALKNSGALIMLAAASVVVGLAGAALRGNRRGWLRERAADAMESAWHVVVLLTLPVIILEDVGLLQAFRRAGQLHRRHLGDLLVAWFGVGLFNRVLGLAAMLVVTAVGVALYVTLGLATLPLVIALGLTVVVVLSILTAYLNTAYYTCLYLWAAATERAKVPVPAPAPLDVALGW